MKRLVAIVAVAALLSSCVKEAVEPGMRISGTYAYYDGTGLSNQYVSFDNGYYSEVSLTQMLSYMEDSYWGYNKSYESVRKNRYSIQDGNLLVSGKPRGAVEIKDDFLYFQGKKYCKVKAFNEEPYSSIVLPEGTMKTISYESKEYAVPVTINRPIPAGTLSASTTASWISGVKVQDGYLIFRTSETKVDRSGTIGLSYTNADDLTLSINQRPSTFIKLGENERTVAYSQSSQSISYTIENPLPGSALDVSCTSNWVKNIVVGAESVTFDVEEYPGSSSRIATLICSYSGAANVSFTLTQSGAVTAIVPTPYSQSCTYTGGVFSFDFTVENPRQGLEVTATSQTSWITDVAIEGNTVSYKVDENNSGTSRTGRIRLAYGDYATTYFIVNQSGIPVQSLSLNKNTLALLTGNSETLVATVDPTDAPLQWASDNALVATVNQSGMVSAVGNGTATITVSAENGKTSSCTVTVTTAVTGITLNKTSLSLAEGAQEQLTATISPSTASDKTITWSSDNTSVVTIDQSGQVTAVSKGITTITASANDGSGKYASCSVTVGNYINLSANGSANCYIVSSAGNYCFRPNRGNSSTSVGCVSSAEVLWESFGTATTPSVGSIIGNVSYSNNTIFISTPSILKSGNAVIAAKDDSGEILWSWHIWVCKDFDPVATEQEYYNNAGTMMDRNLGATSAEPGDVGALGLLYQWGRKDPFLGGSQISYSSVINNTKAASTLSWPSPVRSDSSNGTIEYVIAHPTTFILMENSDASNNDWYYTGSSTTENTRWQSIKTIYDPCPPGWHVPDGGRKGVWSKAVNNSSTLYYNWDSTYRGINFSRKFGSADTIWWPAAGSIDSISNDHLSHVGEYGEWWSCTPDSRYACRLFLRYDGQVRPDTSWWRAIGISVRCAKE